MTNELREEIKRLWEYDGPSHPEWSSGAVRTSLQGVVMFLAFGMTEVDDLAQWAFDEGLFPQTETIIEVDEESVRWRPGVEPPLKEEVSSFAQGLARSNMHVHPRRSPR